MGGDGGLGEAIPAWSEVNQVTGNDYDSSLSLPKGEDYAMSKSLDVCGHIPML